MARHTHNELLLTFFLVPRKKKEGNTQKQQLFAEPPSHLLLSVDEFLGREANFCVKNLAQKLAHKWDKFNSEALRWIRAQLSFAILRVTNLCLRGSRTKWRSTIRMDDGAGLPSLS